MDQMINHCIKKQNEKGRIYKILPENITAYGIIPPDTSDICSIGTSNKITHDDYISSYLMGYDYLSILQNMDKDKPIEFKITKQRENVESFESGINKISNSIISNTKDNKIDGGNSSMINMELLKMYTTEEYIELFKLSNNLDADGKRYPYIVRFKDGLTRVVYCNEMIPIYATINCMIRHIYSEELNIHIDKYSLLTDPKYRYDNGIDKVYRVCIDGSIIEIKPDKSKIEKFAEKIKNNNGLVREKKSLYVSRINRLFEDTKGNIYGTYINEEDHPYGVLSKLIHDDNIEYTELVLDNIPISNHMYEDGLSINKYIDLINKSTDIQLINKVLKI